MRFKKELPKLLLKDTMEFAWGGKNYTYKFQTLSGKKTWSNPHMKVDGLGPVTNQKLTS